MHELQLVGGPYDGDTHAPAARLSEGDPCVIGNAIYVYSRAMNRLYFEQFVKVSPCS